ncbi:hypothetical protein ACQEU8_27660 [Streptomyces sp. CA-250714]|uniref:hypothetical protein n=1 Tax=Streptomyces sp. CA-250714 TaxID=3240060 RepID=UPI003D8FF2F8
MGTRRQRFRYGRALSGTAALALLCGLGACLGTAGRGHDHGPFQHTLDRQAAALRGGDEPGYLTAVDPGHRGEQRRAFHNLRRLPLAEWSYDVRKVTKAHDIATVEATLRYRLAGYDRVASTATERLRFVRRDGAWRIAAEASGSDAQLWEQGTMTVVRGSHSLVLGVGRKRSELRALADAADRAVPAVTATWPDGWSRRPVLEAPASTRQMARLLGSPAANSRTYAGIAAVTTGEVTGAARSDADRIVVNPRAYGLLSEEGRQVVLTHETTHVATRRQTTPATPLWLSEGIADWSGYRRSQLTPKEAAPELARAPDEAHTLPSDGDFHFGNDPAALARAYEGSWLACRMIAEQWGTGKLLALYEQAGRENDGKRPDANAALRSVLGISEKEFTDRWRTYVLQQLRH